MSSRPFNQRVPIRTDSHAAGTESGALGSKPPRRKQRLTVGVASALVIACAAFALVASHWPFTEEAVARGLREGTGSTAQIRAFRRTYFPHPGCVAEGVTLHRDGDANTPPLMTIQKLTIQSTLVGLLTRRLTEIRADGLRLRVPPPGSKPLAVRHGGLSIGRIVVNGAVVEFETRRPRPTPLLFGIHQSTFTFIGGLGSMGFNARLRIPEPPGEVSVYGHLGPWKADRPGETPLTGSYTLEHAALGAFPAIAGGLSSRGKFSGVLERIEVQGTTDMPDFQLTDTGHTVHLGTRFRVAVNGRNGDTFLEAVEAQLQKTSIDSSGAVAASSTVQREPIRKAQEAGQARSGPRGKTVSLEMNGTGRIEDFLWLFTEAKPPRLIGALKFRTKVSVPPGPVRFLRKVNLEGDFEISSASFTNPDTQRGLEAMSTGSKSSKSVNDPGNVVAELRGHVALHEGTARFSNLFVNVSGASAELGGSYSLLNEKIDLRGILRTTTPPSGSTTGIKSVLLKVLDRFFKKQRNFVVPVRIGGTYANPSFGLALGSKK